MMRDLYIIGAGDFGREVVWLVKRINDETPIWNLVGFLDDNESIHGSVIDGLKVCGGYEYAEKIQDKFWAVCSVGVGKIRKKIIKRYSQIGNINFPTLIDPSVIIGDGSVIGNEGTIICAGSVFTVDISVGNHVIVNLSCTLGHDDVINDFVTIHPGVNLSGCVTVGEDTDIGTGSAVIQGIHVGKNTTLGAGTVVIRDVPDNVTAVGNPARIVKR